MIAARHPVHLGVLLAFVCLISGCGQDKVVTNKPETPVKIGFCSAPGTSKQTDTSIAIVELTVLAPIDIMPPLELHVDQEKYIEMDLLLPVGEPLSFSALCFILVNPVKNISECWILIVSSIDIVFFVNGIKSLHQKKSHTFS